MALQDYAAMIGKFDPIAIDQQIAETRGAQQRNRLADFAFAENERATQFQDKRRNALMSAMNPNTGEVDDESYTKGLAGIGDYEGLQTFRKDQSDRAKSKREADKAQLEAKIRNFEVAAQIMGPVKDQATWEIARQQIVEMFGPEAAAQMPAQYDPALIEQKRKQAMPIKDQLEQEWKRKQYDLDSVNEPFTPGADGAVIPNTKYQQYQKEKARAGKTEVTVSQSVGSGDKKYAETRMKDRAETMKSLESSAENAYKQIQSLDRFIQASEKGTSGGAQPLITGVENLISSFGYSSESLKDARIMEQAIGDILGSKMAELGARGLTDKDMQVLREALPRVATDKKSRVSIANILKKSHVATMEEYDNQRKEEARIYPELSSRVPEQLWYKSYKNKPLSGGDRPPIGDIFGDNKKPSASGAKPSLANIFGQ